MSEQKNITRVGEAVFPYLTKPDTEYNSEGVYHVKLKLKKIRLVNSLKELMMLSLKKLLKNTKKDLVQSN